MNRIKTIYGNELGNKLLVCKIVFARSQQTLMQVQL